VKRVCARMLHLGYITHFGLLLRVTPEDARVTASIVTEGDHADPLSCADSILETLPILPFQSRE
jgi:hypothetical protein